MKSTFGKESQKAIEEIKVEITGPKEMDMRPNAKENVLEVEDKEFENLFKSIHGAIVLLAIRQ